MLFPPASFAGLAGRTAVVTGATRGIGAALARSLLHNGTNVVAGDIDFLHLLDTVERLRNECVSYAQIVPVETDVCDPSQLTALANVAISQFGRLDYWINNAGVFGINGVMDITAEELSKVFGVNVNGAVFGTQAAARAMAESGGAILNISSIAATVVRPTMATYGGSKAAIDHLTRFQAVELGPRNIRVNCVAPGMIETGMLDWISDQPDLLSRTVESIPLRRLGQPEEVADAALFLLSDASRFITGQTLVVDGGVRNR